MFITPIVELIFWIVVLIIWCVTVVKALGKLDRLIDLWADKIAIKYFEGRKVRNVHKP